MKTLTILLLVTIVGCNNNPHLIESSPTPTQVPTAIPTSIPTLVPTVVPTTTPVPSNPNLVCDGGFEGIYSGSSWDVFDHLDLPPNCWKIRNITAGLEVQFTGVTLPSPQGSYIAELDSHLLYGLTKTNVEIYQVLNTVPGLAYELKFAYASRTVTSSSNMVVNISEVHGVNLVSTFSTTYSSNQSGFKYYSVKFVATSCKTYVSFKGVGTEDSLGALLDDVSVKKYLPNIDCDCN